MRLSRNVFCLWAGIKFLTDLFPTFCGSLPFAFLRGVLFGVSLQITLTIFAHKITISVHSFHVKLRNLMIDEDRVIPGRVEYFWFYHSLMFAEYHIRYICKIPRTIAARTFCFTFGISRHVRVSEEKVGYNVKKKEKQRKTRR